MNVAKAVLVIAKKRIRRKSGLRQNEDKREKWVGVSLVCHVP